MGERELHSLDKAAAIHLAAKRRTPANKVPGNRAVNIRHLLPPLIG
jgi:hypothetical protein